MNSKLKELVERFQCPGCVSGSNTKCGVYDPLKFDAGGSCSAHVPGIRVLGGSSISIGLPKGFNRLGSQVAQKIPNGNHPLVLYSKDTHPGYDKFSVPVWAWQGQGEWSGFLFVRVLEPRIGRTRVDVIEAGTLKLVEGAIDVQPFLEEMD